MRAESGTKPRKAFEIESVNGIASIRFFRNVEKVTREGEDGTTHESWAYDELLLHVPDRAGLADQIEAHLDDWIAFAQAEARRPEPETEREIIARLQGELDQLQAENAFLLLELAKGEIQ